MRSGNPYETFHWSSRVIAPPGNVSRLRRAVAGRPEGVLLESTLVGRKAGRYSIFAFDPARVISSTPGKRVVPEEGTGTRLPGTSKSRRLGATSGAFPADDSFRQLEDVCRPWVRFADTPDLPFVGGWIGYLSYEAGRFVEPSARFHGDPAGGLPLSRWALFDTVLIHDALADTWYVAGVELPESLAGIGRTPLPQRLASLERFVEEACATARPPAVAEGTKAPRDRGIEDAATTTSAATGLWHRRPACDPTGETPAPHQVWNYSREAYFAKVERALEYIRAGDIFQVNLTRRCRFETSSSPMAIYERLRESNPAAYAAYLPTPSPPGAVLSSSPELFLSVRGDEVITRPIKGTRPRGRTSCEDALLSEALVCSEKDRAELNMIIDLERNDLGRVCRFGSVRVVHDGEIEPLATVFHRTATITGRLREDADTIDLLRATFPGGSVTGAPKVRAMQIIHELEPDARGPYCGAIGWVALDGDATLNLAIRTMTVSGGHADIHVGSGIVADSDPVDEHDELQAKAAGMIAALRPSRPIGTVESQGGFEGNPKLAGSHHA
ncbi:MAG: aminodeoxychorismate synthase component I [Planctomycetota bacterium]